MSWHRRSFLGPPVQEEKATAREISAKVDTQGRTEESTRRTAFEEAIIHKASNARSSGTTRNSLKENTSQNEPDQPTQGSVPVVFSKQFEEIRPNVFCFRLVGTSPSMEQKPAEFRSASHGPTALPSSIAGYHQIGEQQGMPIYTFK